MESFLALSPRFSLFYSSIADSAGISVTSCVAALQYLLSLLASISLPCCALQGAPGGTYATNRTVKSADSTPNNFNSLVCLLSSTFPSSQTVYSFCKVIFPFTNDVGTFKRRNSGSRLCAIGTSSSAGISPPVLYTVPAGMVKVREAGVPLRA
jgi:hypothetical protein